MTEKAENQEVSEQSKDEAQSNDKPLTLGARKAQTVGVSVSGETEVLERELNHERVQKLFQLKDVTKQETLKFTIRCPKRHQVFTPLGRRRVV